MGLNGVMTNALSGMRVTQSGLDVVSQNISNADSVGYVRRRANVVEQPLGNTAGFARVSGIQRMLDKVVQRQLWNETAGAGYTSTRADMLGALDQAYGAPASSNSLGAVFGRFTQSLQQLKADPANSALRSSVVSTAQEVAVRLKGLSGDIQNLRNEAERGIEAGVARTNEVLKQIQAVNANIISGTGGDESASLRDQRDRLVTELSRYMDIRTSESDAGGISIFSSSGITLFSGSNATVLTFDAATSVGADQLWNANDALRGVGTIRAQNGFGGATDLIATNSLRSGEIAAFVEMRDKTLVEAQNQLDEFAAAMASSLSDREIAGTPAIVGAATGFDVDINGLSAGNQITLDYTDSTTGTKGRFTFVRADSAAAVAAINGSGMSSADNLIIGIDFTGFPGSMAGIAAQIGTALGAGFTVSNPAGTTLRIVDDGAANTRNVDALVSRPTSTGFSAASPNGVAEMPFFIDKGVVGGLYTGSFEGRPQMRGLSARIAVNPLIEQDRSRLVQFQTGPTTPQGDATRVDMMYQRLTGSTRTFSPLTGIGGSASAHRSTVGNFAQRIVETQGNTIENSFRLNEGQQIAVKSVEARFTEKSGVSVDQEMANLVELQNAYAANARVIAAVRELMDVLLRI